MKFTNESLDYNNEKKQVLEKILELLKAAKIEKEACQQKLTKAHQLDLEAQIIAVKIDNLFKKVQKLLEEYKKVESREKEIKIANSYR